MTETYETPHGFQRWMMVFAAVLGSAVFDLTWVIVGVALPYMQGTFSATPDQMAWVMVSFIVGGTMMTAVTGWASTRFGRKQLFIAALLANMVATMMCGLADSLMSEVFWRFIQGVFSAPLLAIGQALAIDAFPSHKRSFATGIWSASTVGAVVIAPLIGGYMVEHISWRWVFFISVPMAGSAALCAYLFVPNSKPEPGRRIEWIGFSALITTVGSLQLALSRGERLDWFDSHEIVAYCVIALIGAIVVVIRTVLVKESFLDKRLFIDRNFLVSTNIMILFGGLVTLPMILMPLMLQQVNGYPAISAGALILPRGLGLVVASLVVGQLGRTDPRIILAFGFVCTAVTNLYAASWTVDIDQWAVIWTNFAHGIAAGSIFVPMVSIALATLNRRLHTEALTFMFLLLNIGKALGVAGIFVVYTRVLQTNHWVLSEYITTTNERLRQIEMPQSWDIATQPGLASIAVEIGRQAELIAYLNAFLIIGIAAAAVVPLLAFLKRPPLEGTSEEPT